MLAAGQLQPLSTLPARGKHPVAPACAADGKPRQQPAAAAAPTQAAATAVVCRHPVAPRRQPPAAASLHAAAAAAANAVPPLTASPAAASAAAPAVAAAASAAADSVGAFQPDEQAAQSGGTRKVSLVSLGCPKNVVDLETIGGDLRRAGFELTADKEAADAIIVNTCAFVEDAKKESLEAIIEAASLNAGGGKQRQVVVTGCLAQRYGASLAADLPEADLVVGFEGYANLPGALAQRLGAAGSGATTPSPPSISSISSRVQVGSATVPFRPEAERHRLTPRHSAYLRVAEGCDHKCTFCAIPSFRGRFRSKPWDALLEEAAALVASGVRELNLIAEDTNQWGMDRRDSRGLAGLLRELSALEGLDWLRLLYCYPSYFDDALVEEIASNPKVCKYIDMPLQHHNNLTLLAMNRPPQAHTEQLLQKLRDRIPGLVLRTTFIAGFPGESEAAHRELVEFVREGRFQRMGAFAYSEEDSTPAADLPDQVPQHIRERRRDELVQVQQRVSQAFAASLVGRQLDVLVDGVTEDGWLYGRTQYDAPDVDPIVFLSDPPGGETLAPLEVGQMRRCLITSNTLFDLEAHPVA